MGLAWLQTTLTAPLLSYASAFTASSPSSSIAELAAIFTAILVAPPLCQIKIYTDSSTVIAQFNKYKLLSSISPSQRPFLKIINVYLWNGIFQVINTLALEVTLHKVKAHSGNHANEQVDKLAKDALVSSALHFTVNDQIHTSILFNDLIIASPIRPFIKECIRANAFTSFLNLDINTRYSQEVDWLSTAFYISDNISSAATNYIASSTKKKKTLRLLEMLPTLEVFKRRHPVLYETSWTCNRCNIENETFAHVWTCITVYRQVCDIIETVKHHLANITQCNNMEPIDQLNIWALSTHTSFSFIDLIKGVVPSNLSKFINSSITSQADARAATSNFMHFIYEQTQVIWLNRCMIFKEFEMSLGITESLKKTHINASGYNIVTSHDVFSSSLFIDNMVRLGSHWTNFWCSRGQAFFLF